MMPTVMAAAVILDGLVNGFTITDILAGILTTLVLLLVKKVGDLEKAVAALLPQVDVNTKEINRIRDARHADNNRTHEVLIEYESRIAQLEQSDEDDGDRRRN